METITFTYKTKVEQFKEQFPELYQEIYSLGYKDGMDKVYSDTMGADPIDSDDIGSDEYFMYEPEYAVRADDSPRFLMDTKWEKVYDKAVSLESEGYQCGNRDWREFMSHYQHDSWRRGMIIAWNPTHKIFAVESDYGTIAEMYPHLVDAVEE